MRCDPAHPELSAPPDHTVLGPDPEPLDTERNSELTRAPAPHVCPLSAAFGRDAPCSGGACLFYLVPGMLSLCAVDHWSPEARRDRALAAWYLARRVEAAGGVRRDDPIAIPLHTLETPGPGE